jgi:hypothetical protein
MLQVELDSLSLTTAIGDETAFTDVVAEVQGQQLSSEIGIVDPSPDAMVIGIDINASVDGGSVIIGTADIDVTGIQLT